MELEYAEATGRMIAAARMLAGLDQGELAARAKVSSATVSNIEGGRTEAREATMKALRKALQREEITFMHDTRNNRITLTIDYDDPD